MSLMCSFRSDSHLTPLSLLLCPPWALGFGLSGTLFRSFGVFVVQPNVHLTSFCFWLGKFIASWASWQLSSGPSAPMRRGYRSPGNVVGRSVALSAGRIGGFPSLLCCALVPGMRAPAGQSSEAHCPCLHVSAPLLEWSLLNLSSCILMCLNPTDCLSSF